MCRMFGCSCSSWLVGPFSVRLGRVETVRSLVILCQTQDTTSEEVVGAVVRSEETTFEGDVAAQDGLSSDEGGYTIDRDAIPSVVADLRRALGSWENAAREAERHTDLVPPGDDPHSLHATSRVGARLVQDYLAANAHGRRRVQALIDELESAMRTYDRADETAAESVP